MILFAIEALETLIFIATCRVLRYTGYWTVLYCSYRSTVKTTLCQTLIGFSYGLSFPTREVVIHTALCWDLAANSHLAPASHVVIWL